MRSQDLFNIILLRESGGVGEHVTGNFTSKVVFYGRDLEISILVDIAAGVVGQLS